MFCHLKHRLDLLSNKLIFYVIIVISGLLIVFRLFMLSKDGNLEIIKQEDLLKNVTKVITVNINTNIKHEKATMKSTKVWDVSTTNNE